MKPVGTYPFDDIIDKILDFASIDWDDTKSCHGGQRIKICCILPGHKETVPSLVIDRDGGRFRCFGCGHKGSIFEFGRLIGIDVGSGREAIIDPDFDEFAAMSSKLEDVEKSQPTSVVIPPHLHKLPPSFIWRGMPASFLSKAGAMMWYDPRSYIERVWFPCLQDQELIGWFARIRNEKDKDKFRTAVALAKSAYLELSKSKGNKRDLSALEEDYKKAKDRLDRVDGMKYRNDDNQKTYKILFPLDFMMSRFPESKSVVLVEGQIDALWLIYNGIPALSILGTNNWSETKEAILTSNGFNRLILAMDGDDPGQKAQERLYKILKYRFRKVIKWRCPADKDPALLSKKELKDLKSLVRGRGYNDGILRQIQSS